MAANLNQRPQNFYTLEEYFALEKSGETRYEYWNGEIFCMSGGSYEHATISGNIFLSLGQKLKGSKCRPFNSDMAILTPQLPPYRYPDVSIACNNPDRQKVSGIDALTNPTIIFEVLSPWTEEADRKPKKEAYQAIESVQEYLIISQNSPHISQFIRQGNIWMRKDFGNLSAIVELPSIGCNLALGDVYDGIEFQ